MSYIYLLYFIIILHLVICMVIKSLCVLTNINTLITLNIWLLFIYLAYYFNNVLFLAGPIVLLIINEIAYVKFNIDCFNGEARTKLMYDITTTYFVNHLKNNTNLTEGMYLNDLSDNNSLMT